MSSPLLFDFVCRTRVVFGASSVGRLGELASQLKFSRTLLVADPGMVAAGYARRAADLLAAGGIQVFPFHDFAENPDAVMVARGTEAAASARVDSIVGLGGGSSLDCAKGINFLLTQGGAIHDYKGFGKAHAPMLPMIGIPTTAGTGSEAQCFALISDPVTHMKMPCGDPKAAFRVAILDPELTVSQPAAVTAITGYDAISHAVETYVTTRRNPVSEMFSREAWRLLEANYERVLVEPMNVDVRAAMQLGAYYGGVAIDMSMLGGAHACANPLTAHYGTTHGVAVATMLPHVVRWNGADAAVGHQYDELLHAARRPSQRAADPAQRLALRLEELAQAAGLPRNLRAMGAKPADIQMLAAEAAGQMTARFNPRRFDASSAVALYETAL